MKNISKKSLIFSRHGLTIESIIIRLSYSYCCYSHYFLSKTHFNSCKMEHFIYTGVCGIHVQKFLKEKLAWVIDKQFQFTISYYTMPLETCKEAIG